MSRLNVYRILLFASLFSFILCALVYLTGRAGLTGPFMVAGFILLAIAVRGYPAFKGFSYSLWIFTAVTVSMYYPGYFIEAGGFELQKLIVPLLQIIMFGMGSQMSLNDFAGVVKMPRGVIAGIVCQYTLMPFIGLVVAMLFRFPPEIAAGILLVGTSPSGLASNVMSFLARANLALSITLTAVATILSPFVTPFLMKSLAGQMVEVDFWNMMLGIFDMVILPIVAGLIFNIFSLSKVKGRQRVAQLSGYFLVIVLKNFIAWQAVGIPFGEFLTGIGTNVVWFMLLPVAGALIFNFLAGGNRDVLNKSLAFLSMLGIGVIITIITAAGRDSLLDVGLLLILACLIHNLSGYALGYSIARYVLKMNEQDSRTISLEVGMQNGGLASGLALQMGKVATVGLAPAIFGPMMNITGSSLATWWRSKNVKKEKTAYKTVKTIRS